MDGKEAPVLLEEVALKEHSSHWEGGTRRNMDTGLYEAHTLLYIKVADYGPKPKVGKQLVLSDPPVDGKDKKNSRPRTYLIAHCEEEDGVYRMTLERRRQ